MKKLNKISQIIAKKIDTNQYQKEVTCNDIEHAMFVIKSDNMLNQISTKLKFIKIKECLFPVNNETILPFSILKKGNRPFDIYRIKQEEIERLESIIKRLQQESQV